jgi:hypothetical protein
LKYLNKNFEKLKRWPKPQSFTVPKKFSEITAAEDGVKNLTTALKQVSSVLCLCHIVDIIIRVETGGLAQCCLPARILYVWS